MTSLRSIWLKRVVAATALLVGAAVPARADIVIDNFNDPTIPSAVIVNGNASNGTVITTAAPLGPRAVTLDVTSTPIQSDSLGVSQDGTIVTGATSGTFSIALNNNSSANVTLDYSFTSAQNFTPGGVLGTIDLTTRSDGGASFLPSPLTLTIHSAGGTSTYTGVLPVGPFTTQHIALSSFTGTADLTAVTGFTATIQADAAKDILLDDVGVSAPSNPVPAPPAALLAAAALPALGLRRALRKKTA